MRIGAHVSTAGGLQHAIMRAVGIGAECAQVFVGAPQRWFGAKHTDDEIAEFRRLAEVHDVGPNVVHALYLVNLASPDPAQRERSVNALVNQMHWCEKMGVMGLVVHVGSGKGVVPHDECLEHVVNGVEHVLGRSEGVRFIVENTAGMGTSIGADFSEIGYVIRCLGNDERLRVCLDTAHTFESGHDITTKEGLEAVLDRFDQDVGLDRLVAVHANDSKTAFGSNVDRHENIGHGLLGEDALGNFMTHPAVRNLPFYLEVPGLAGRGPDRENIDVLRDLAGLLPLPPPAGPWTPAPTDALPELL